MSHSVTAVRENDEISPVPISSSRVSTVLPAALALVAMIAYALFFGWLSLERYWAYDMHALDMGNMGQAAWNTIHGHPFFFTNMRLPYEIEAWKTATRLSFHVEALFPVISLVYVLYPHPESLLVLQTIALALGAVPVFLLARDILRNSWLALLFALLYLGFPTLEAMNLYEFHPVALATPLLLSAFLFLVRGQSLPFVLCCLAAMGTKEEIGLVVAMFGLYAAVVAQRRRLGFSLAAVGVAWSLLAALVIEHHYRQPGSLSYLHTRYGYLGKGVGGAIHTLTHDPGTILEVLFIWPKLDYLERLLAPAGYLPLLAPLALLLGAPTFLLNLFSTDQHMYSGLGDNSAELVSVMMIAAILGTRWLLRVLQIWLSPLLAAGAVALYLLVQGLWSQHLNGFTPIGSAYQAPVIGQHQHLADRFVSRVPPTLPVSTQDQLDPHLSSRHDLYLFEDIGRETYPGVPPANYVLLDVSAPTYPLPSYQLHDRAMSLLSRGWGVSAADDGLILLRRGAHSRRIPSSFYRYAEVHGVHIQHRLHASASHLQILGYGLTHVDQPNADIPNSLFTLYFRPASRRTPDRQPVIFESMNGHLMDCVHSPLGLAWMPTTRWREGRTYSVHMDPLQTNWNVPGTARLSLEIVPVSRDPQPSCQALWARRGQTVPVGTINVPY